MLVLVGVGEGVHALAVVLEGNGLLSDLWVERTAMIRTGVSCAQASTAMLSCERQAVVCCVDA